MNISKDDLRRFPFLILYSSLFLLMASVALSKLNFALPENGNFVVFEDTVLSAFYVLLFMLVCLLAAVTFYMPRLNAIQRIVCLADLILLIANCIVWFALIYALVLSPEGLGDTSGYKYLTLSVMVFTSNGILPSIDYEPVSQLLILQSLLGFLVVPMLISSIYLVVATESTRR